MKQTAVELIQKLKDKAFQTENDKKLIESFEIERLKQLTPVEWFYEQLPGHIRVSEKVLEILQQAKEKERQLIITAIDSVELVKRFYYKNGEFDEELLGKEVPDSEFNTYFGLSKNGEQYYNETFKQQEQ